MVMRPILCADDDPITLKILEKHLPAFGFEPTLVTNGIAALDILSHRDAPQFAILDWMMPGYTGIEVCEAIAGLPHRAFMYVLILSSRVSPEDVQAGLIMGADDYLKKPIDLLEIRTRLGLGARVCELRCELHEVRRTVVDLALEISTASSQPSADE